MSWVTLSNKKVKIKKERVCHGCNVKYAPGTTMVNTVGVNDGDFNSTYWCTVCNDFMSDKWNDVDDGIGEGDCWEYSEYQQYRERVVQQDAPAGQ